LDVIRANGPVPPIKFYQAVKAVISTEESKTQKINMTFDVNEFERSVLAYEPASGKVKPCQLKAVCVDSMGRQFANVSYFWSYHEMKSLGYSDFGSEAVDRDHELYEQMECDWIKLGDIKGGTYTVCCARDEFKKRMLMSELPAGNNKNHPTKFCRTKFFRTTMERAEERTIVKVSNGKGASYDKLMLEAGIW